jgi:hypothetical protein
MYLSMSPIDNTGLDDYLTPEGELLPWQDWPSHDTAMEYATPVRIPYTDGIVKSMLLALRKHDVTGRSISHDVGCRVIENFMLPRRQGELEEWIRKLFGPSDLESFNHLVGFIICLVSNNLLEHHKASGLIKKVIGWLTTKSTCSLRALFSMRVPSVQAFLHTLSLP